MSDHIDKGEAGSFKDGQEELFDLDPESEQFDEIDKAYRREKLQWLAESAIDRLLETLKSMGIWASSFYASTAKQLPYEKRERIADSCEPGYLLEAGAAC
jgi:hypothetical protein